MVKKSVDLNESKPVHFRHLELHSYGVSMCSKQQRGRRFKCVCTRVIQVAGMLLIDAKAFLACYWSKGHIVISWFCFYTCIWACSCSIITHCRSLHCILSRCWLTRGFTGMLLWSGQIWHCDSLVVFIDQTSFWSILFSTAKFKAVGVSRCVCLCMGGLGGLQLAGHWLHSWYISYIGGVCGTHAC